MSPADAHRPARLAPAAIRDLREATRWIAADNPDAADALVDAVNRAARLLGQHPEMGATRPALAPARFRFLLVRDFPYLMIYEIERETPRVLRVLHTARDLRTLLSPLWN